MYVKNAPALLPGLSKEGVRCCVICVVYALVMTGCQVFHSSISISIGIARATSLTLFFIAL